MTCLTCCCLYGRDETFTTPVQVAEKNQYCHAGRNLFSSDIYTFVWANKTIAYTYKNICRPYIILKTDLMHIFRVVKYITILHIFSFCFEIFSVAKTLRKFLSTVAFYCFVLLLTFLLSILLLAELLISLDIIVGKYLL